MTTHETRRGLPPRRPPAECQDGITIGFGAEGCPHGPLGRAVQRIERGWAGLMITRYGLSGLPQAECYPLESPPGRWFWIIRNTRSGECEIVTHESFERLLGPAAEERCAAAVVLMPEGCRHG